MIKKINYLLVLISIIGSIVILLISPFNIVNFLKTIAIFITILIPYILEKLFKTKIEEKYKFVIILFVFMAHFLGVIVNLYDKVLYYDKIMHFISGIVTAFLSIKLVSSKNKYINAILLIIISLAVASIWEIFEYISSITLNIDPQKVIETGIHDTMQDIIVAFLGSILVSICYLKSVKEKI